MAKKKINMEISNGSNIYYKLHAKVDIRCVLKAPSDYLENDNLIEATKQQIKEECIPQQGLHHGLPPKDLIKCQRIPKDNWCYIYYLGEDNEYVYFRHLYKGPKALLPKQLSPEDIGPILGIKISDWRDIDKLDIKEFKKEDGN